jgi:DNA-binding LytR/AlgR family response regulator
MTRAIIVDDEHLMREQLRLRLSHVWPELTICGEAADAEAAMKQIEKETPDLVFLDIRMPGATGIELAKRIGQRCHIVFVTAYDQYAIEAFERGAVDYLLKPVEEDRLAVTVDRLRQRLDQKPADLESLLSRLSDSLSAPKPAYLRWIQASVGPNLRFIPADDIVFFRAEDKYTRVLLASAEALIRKPIKELVAELDPQQFWQIHRATIVNVQAISGVARDFRGRQLVTLKGRPERLEFSRSFSHLFKQM